MPLHRDATYVNMHPPLGASLDGGDQPLNLISSAYAQHWRNHNARDVLLLDTSFANITIAQLGNATDPAALVLPGVSEVQSRILVLPVHTTDPPSPSVGAKLYTKDVAGTDHLFARNDAGTVYQLTPTSSGSFDPTAIALTDNLSGAFRAHEAANDYIRVNTTDASEAVILGNATTNPVFELLGSGVLTLGSGRVAKTGNLLIGNHTVAPGGTSVIALGAKTAGAWTSNNQVVIGETTGNYGAGAIVIASRVMTGAAGGDSITISSSATSVATGADSVAIGTGALASATSALALGSDCVASGASSVALGDSTDATQSGALAAGWLAQATGTAAIAIGQSANAAHQSIALGRDAATTAAGQVVIGGNAQPYGDFYLGEGVTKTTALVISEVTLQPTERTGTDGAGAALRLRGGRGTGAGVGGSIILQTHPALGPGTTAHTATTRLEINNAGAWLLGGAAGTATHVLTSNGAGTPPTWQAAVSGFDPTAIALTDNLSGAFRAHEAANDYIRVNTNNGTESIILGNATTNPSISLLGSGALLWNVARQITLPDNTASVFRLMEGANEYFGLATSNGTEAIRFGNATTNPSVTFTGSGALTLPTGHITIPDNTATAFRVREAANNYFFITTTNTTESMELGNATTNPAFSFLGSGTLTLPTGGVSIPDNGATAFRILEGANSYLTINTTNTTERIVLGNATTNPVIEFAGSGHLNKTGNITLGSFNSLPGGTQVVAIGDFPSVTTFTNNDKILIGRATGTNLAAARSVTIAATGATGTFGSDSITIQSAGGGGATGNRSIQIGGAATCAGVEAVGIGYAATAAHANTVCLGRAATSTAASQFVVGGNAQPITDFYLGEGVTQASAFTPTLVSFQPTEGTGTDRAGLHLVLRGGRGTGTGKAGAFSVETYPSTTTGTTAHTASERFSVDPDGWVGTGTGTTKSRKRTDSAGVVYADGWKAVSSVAVPTAAWAHVEFRFAAAQLVAGSGAGQYRAAGVWIEGSGTLTNHTVGVIQNLENGFAALEWRIVTSGTSVVLEARTTAVGGSVRCTGEVWMQQL